MSFLIYSIVGIRLLLVSFCWLGYKGLFMSSWPSCTPGSTKLCEDNLLLMQQMQSAGCDYSAVAQTISECTGNLIDS